MKALVTGATGFVGAAIARALSDAGWQVRVLVRSGWCIEAPARQGCCGALHLHAGFKDAARAYARRTIAAFGTLAICAIAPFVPIAMSSGCAPGSSKP